MRNIVPQIPSSLRKPILHAVETTRIRRVPHYYLPPSKQGNSTKAGAFLLGDASNMRHPLTAGGMTVALHDVVLLSDLLMDVENLGNWKEVSAVVEKWCNMRKPLASTINTMSMCWAGVFSGDCTFRQLFTFAKLMRICSRGIHDFAGRRIQPLFATSRVCQ